MPCVTSLLQVKYFFILGQTGREANAPLDDAGSGREPDPRQRRLNDFPISRQHSKIGLRRF
jgi:hypothetical protein